MVLLILESSLACRAEVALQIGARPWKKAALAPANERFWNTKQTAKAVPSLMATHHNL